MSKNIKEEEENNVDISENEANIIKRTEPQFVFSIITRYINLINDSEKQVKKETVTKLHKFICLDQPSFKRELVQEILISFNNNLIKYSLFNEIDKIREYSIKILIYLYANCVNITKFLPFIFSALSNKLQCDDLEGYGNLPENIRPTPSQNPQKIIKVTESIEEIRILYLKLLEAIINHDNSAKDDFRLFVQDIVNITRTLCMDPAPNVVLVACNFCKNLAITFSKDLLYYFNSILSRGVLYALSHKQAKLRIAALEALDKLMLCSPFKKNVEIMEQLIGFRDPNVVPIKDFYEPTTKFNYLAFLSSDINQAVLLKFYEVIFDWLLNAEDRVDHESRLIPYVLTGLFNKNENVANFVYDKFIEMGELHEKTNAKDYREQKEYGIDVPYIKYLNKNKDFVIPYPPPIKTRPNLGCRKIVISYIRRYIKNLTREFEGIDNDIKYKVANLLLYSIVFSEDGIVEYLDGILLLFMKDFLKVSNNFIDNLERNIFVNKNAISQIIEINNVLIKSCEMIGVFCDYESFSKILYPTIKGDLNGDYEDIQRGAIITFKYIFIGHCNCSNDGLGVFKNKLNEFLNIFGDKEKIKTNIDSRSAYDVINFYRDVINCIANNISKFSEENKEEFKKETENIFLNILQSLGMVDFLNNLPVYQYIDTFLKEINKNMKIIFNDNDYNFFTMHSIDVLKEIDNYLTTNYISMQNKYYKILYIFLNLKDLFFKNIDINSSSKEEALQNLIPLLFALFNKIYDKDENFNVHSNALNLLISFLNSIDDKFNYVKMDAYQNLLLNILKPYTTINSEEFQFKFVDLLKEQKELDKKKMKNPKTLKTELRKNVLLYIKNMFNKSEQFKLKGNINKENINTFLCIFNDYEILKYFIQESEQIRLLFINIYYLYLVKYFVINTENGKVDLLNITEIYEKYFLEMVYDNNVEIRKMCFTLLNVVLSQIPKSQFYEPMRNVFKDQSKEMQQFQMEALKAMAYIDSEKKELEKYFKNFKDVLSSIINEILNEKVIFGSVCNNSMKLIIERFPIYIFNELVKAQKKGQLSRIEFFDSQLKKNFNN
jgi:hypothetical protein